MVHFTLEMNAWKKLLVLPVRVFLTRKGGLLSLCAVGTKPMGYISGVQYAIFLPPNNLEFETLPLGLLYT